MEYSHQLVTDLLQTGGTRFFPERLVEIVGEGEVLAEPPF
jgi:hypothetical protein